MADDPEKQGPNAIKLSRLRQCHPTLDLKHISVLRALFKGGTFLLKNDAVMKEVFPKHEGETDESYKERRKRAYYVNNFGAVINYIVAGLAQDPIVFARKDEDGEEVELDDYWQKLVEDAGAPETKRVTFDQAMRMGMRDALVCNWSWIQVDLPPAVEGAVSLAEEVEAGVDQPYLVPRRCEEVTDWSMKAGKLKWVRTYSCECPDDDPAKPRDRKVHTWMIWDAVGWRLYRVEETEEKPLDDEQWVVPTEGVHSFGKVPFVRIELDDGLCAGDMLYSLVTEYMNQGNADSWNRIRNGYQQLYEFLGTEIGGIDTPVSTAQQDVGRARRQRRGPGTVQVRGQEDDARFVGPDMNGTAVQREALKELKDDIYRITGQMALSQDTSGAMIKRSGESKAQDGIATEVVLGALGTIERASAEEVAKLCAVAHGGEPPEIAGAESFSVTDVETLINNEVMLATAGVQSATYTQERHIRLVRADLGDSLPPKTLATIEKEIRESTTQDQLLMQNEAKEAALDREIKGEPPPGKPMPGAKPPMKKKAEPPMMKKKAV